MTRDTTPSNNTTAVNISRRSALWIVLVYALFGALWIAFSDVLVARFVSEPHLTTQIALVKGWAFIVATSLLLFFLIRRMQHGIETALQKLQNSEDSYRSIIDSVNDAIIIHDPATGAILDVNQRMLEMFGYSREEVQLLTVEQLSSGIPPYTQQEAIAWMAQASAGVPQMFTWQARHKSGRFLWVEVNMRLGRILNEERLIVVTRDIRDRKQIEAQLERKIEEHRTMEEVLRETEKGVRRKLDALLSPEVDLSELELSDIIDCDSIQSLMDALYRVTNHTIAILDMHGNVLVQSGRQNICTEFHRINPETCRLCTESAVELSSGVPAGTFKIYRCKNNMWDMVSPIMMGPRHVGNIFLGQFLFEGEVPDYEIFRQQALRYGFDEQKYLAALDRVPRFKRESIEVAMSFYATFADIIGNLSYSNIKLANVLEERKHAEEELRRLNDELDTRVQERTTKLAEKLSEIESMNKLFVGRELRMVELKEQVKRLKNS